MIIKKTTDFLNEVYDSWKSKFEANCTPSFHNLLWQLIVNEVHDDKTIVLYPVYHNNRLQLSIVFFGETGHLSTGVGFAEGTRYDTATAITAKLNEELFGIKDEAAWEIVARSMKREEPAENVLEDEED